MNYLSLCQAVTAFCQMEWDVFNKYQAHFALVGCFVCKDSRNYWVDTNRKMTLLLLLVSLPYLSWILAWKPMLLLCCGCKTINGIGEKLKHFTGGRCSMFQETLNERTILALLKSCLNTYSIWRRLLLLAFAADFQVLLPVVALSKLIHYIFYY